VGPRLSDGLKQALGEQKVATEGVEYDASLVTNVLPGGCSQSDAEVMAKLITQATTQCPTSKIVVGGYR
jgi:cutinase